MCVLPGRAPSAPLPLLSILLSHWNKPGHVASPLSNSTPNTQTHSTLPPTAPQPLMDTEACRRSTLLFQLLWPSLSLSSAPPQSSLATQNAHLTPSKGLFSTFAVIFHTAHFFPFPSVKGGFSLSSTDRRRRCTKTDGLGVIKRNKMKTLHLLPPTAKKKKKKRTKNREVTEALIATHPYNHIPLLEYCSYLMPFVLSVDKH